MQTSVDLGNGAPHKKVLKNNIILKKFHSNHFTDITNKTEPIF